MKFKLKLWATVAALALSSSAFASISTAADPDLLFVAYDTTGSGATYVRDLGAVSQLTGTADLTFNAPASSIFGTQFGSVNASNIAWGVYAAANIPDVAVVYETNIANNLQHRTDGQVQGVISTLVGSLGGLTQLDLAANGYSKGSGEYSGSTTVTNQTNGLTLIKNFSFGSPKASVGVGSSQNFLSVTMDEDNTSGDVAQLFTNSQLSSFGAGNVGGGYFTLLDSAGDVKWTATVATVPLPAAALLFVPGLLGLFGLGRRNKAA